jgi:hypothetical protein
MLDKPPIFLIGHFRSGTTILWHLFNTSSDFTAYYEPLHPHLLSLIPSQQTKDSHRNVRDYWDAYRPHTETLRKIHSVEFATERLLLEGNESWLGLETYLNTLVKMKESNTQVVLGLNRAGLRVQWLRKKFPDAVILGICREPRQQYMSLRAHIPNAYRLDPWYPDAYEHPFWFADLIPHFPFLAQHISDHPYYGIYLIIKLVREQLRESADYVFELTQDLQNEPENFVDTLSKIIDSPTNTFQNKQKDIVQSSSYVISEEEKKWLVSIEKRIENYLNRKKQTNLFYFLENVVNKRYSRLLEKQMHLTKKHLKYILEYQRQLAEAKDM